jgi:hypothetical protein
VDPWQASLSDQLPPDSSCLCRTPGDSIPARQNSQTTTGGRLFASRTELDSHGRFRACLGLSCGAVQHQGISGLGGGYIFIQDHDPGYIFLWRDKLLWMMNTRELPSTTDSSGSHQRIVGLAVVQGFLDADLTSWMLKPAGFLRLDHTNGFGHAGYGAALHASMDVSRCPAAGERRQRGEGRAARNGFRSPWWCI